MRSGSGGPADRRRQRRVLLSAGDRTFQCPALSVSQAAEYARHGVRSGRRRLLLRLLVAGSGRDGTGMLTPVVLADFIWPADAVPVSLNELRQIHRLPVAHRLPLHLVLHPVRWQNKQQE